MKEQWKNILCNAILMIFVAIFILVTQQYLSTHSYHFSTENENESAVYRRAVVEHVIKEDLEADEYHPGSYTGTQTLELKLLSGPQRGTKITVENSLSTSYQVYLKQGGHLILRVENESSKTPYYEVSQYDRTPVIYLMGGIFILIFFLLSGKKGIRSVLSLVFSAYVILCYLLPHIFHGDSPVKTSILSVVIIATVSFLLINGFHEKTIVAVLATSFGVVCSGILYMIFSGFLHVTGFSTPESEYMLAIIASKGLQLKNVLFAGILISSLGAVMDVAMSVASALYEILLADTKADFKKLFFSGMNVGKDIIGTMSNTLILAFAGSSFAMLFVWKACYQDAFLFINMDEIVIQILQGLCSTSALVLTVPIGSFLGAYLYFGGAKA